MYSYRLQIHWVFSLKKKKKKNWPYAMFYCPVDPNHLNKTFGAGGGEENTYIHTYTLFLTV
jgi:hypothetical protein